LEVIDRNEVVARSASRSSDPRRVDASRTNANESSLTADRASPRLAAIQRSLEIVILRAVVEMLLRRWAGKKLAGHLRDLERIKSAVTAAGLFPIRALVGRHMDAAISREQNWNPAVQIERDVGRIIVIFVQFDPGAGAGRARARASCHLRRESGRREQMVL